MDWTNGFILGSFVGGCLCAVTCMLPSCLRWVYTCNKIAPMERFCIQFYHSHEEKRIVDDVGNTMCVLCFELIEKHDMIIECMTCRKYIGHPICIFKWLESNPTCPLCRS